MPLIRGSDQTDTHHRRVTGGTRVHRGVRAGRAHCEVSLGQRTSCRGSSATRSHELQGDLLARATGALRATPLNHTAGQACSLSPPAAKGQGTRGKGQAPPPKTGHACQAEPCSWSVAVALRTSFCTLKGCVSSGRFMGRSRGGKPAFTHMTLGPAGRGPRLASAGDSFLSGWLWDQRQGEAVFGHFIHNPHEKEKKRRGYTAGLGQLRQADGICGSPPSVTYCKTLCK